MKKNLLIPFFVALAIPALAQQPIYQKSYGGSWFETFRSVAQTSDGGYIVAGETNSFGSGNFDMYVVKTDINGDTTWTTVLGGNNDDRAISAQEVSPGKYLIAGYTKSFGAGNYDVFLTLLDNSGDTIFTRAYGDTLLEYFLANSANVEKTFEGGFILAATRYDSVMSIIHIYTIKTDSAGNLLWANTYYAAGGVERAWSIAQTTDSAYVISGVTAANGPNGDVCLLKIDGDGNILWGKTYGSPGNEEGMSLSVFPNGDIVVFASCNGFNANGYEDILVFRTDANGNLLWSKTYSKPGCVTYVNDGTKDVNGNLVIAGSLRTLSNDFTSLAIKTDGNGDTLWTREVIGNGMYDYFTSVTTCFDGAYLFAGNTDSYGSGYYDATLTRIGPNGEVNCNLAAPPIMVTNVTLTVGSYAPSFSSYGVATYTSPTITHGTLSTTACSGFVGMTESEQEPGFSIYPNPTSGLATINIEPTAKNINQSQSVEIFDATGKIISAENFCGEIYTLDLNDRDPGVYFLRLQVGENFYFRKLVVSHKE